ncbi:angel2 [Symbiodinium natans]|uniref:Angel2 protein n=1 Tax=Symbiodinium natans TaxID=878477 RepID=A0A812HQI3_9DINO|nr:angel2 [Symbiodinium natans]
MGCRAPRVESLLRGRLFPGSDCGQISVLSWNVLAPGHEDGMKVDWDSRLPCLLQHLGLYAACDIMCLQELEKGRSLEPVQEYLAEQGFECVAQKREGKNCYHVINATFFRAARFRLNWTESRSRVLLTGLLLPNGREVCVVNVHLAAVRGEESVAAQLGQMDNALQKMQRVVSSYKIICGDFNNTLGGDSPLVPMLSALGVSRSAPCGPTHHGGLALDHICVGSGLVQELVLTSSQKELAGLRRSLPDKEHPSDHLPVAGLFRIRASDWEIPSLPEPPTREPTMEAWRELCLEDLRPLPTNKKARKERRREHKELEETFLAACGCKERHRLTAWREETRTAARVLCALVLDNALATVRRSKADAVT